MTNHTHNPKGGPRTEAGKARSSQNRLTHGLAAGKIIMPGEDPEEYEALLSGYLDDFEPANNVESTLVHDLATAQWLKLRAIRLSQQAFLTEQAYDLKFLALMDRYQQSNDRAFHRALKALQLLQKERRKDEKKFVSQPVEEILFYKYDEHGNIVVIPNDGLPTTEEFADPPKKAA